MAVPWYEATEDLYVYTEGAAALPARAFAPGDEVPPDLIDTWGWAGQVRIPDVFAGDEQLAAPPARARQNRT